MAYTTSPDTSLPAPSWFALLASSTLGTAAGQSTSTLIRSSQQSRRRSRGPMRLVVQAYAPEDAPGGAPRPGARPYTYAQRRVTAGELRRGVQVDLVDLSGMGARNEAPHVVAWVERGEPDLNFDGRGARPRANSWVGGGRAANEIAEIILRKSAALSRARRGHVAQEHGVLTSACCARAQRYKVVSGGINTGARGGLRGLCGERG